MDAPGDIRFNEISQTQKDQRCIISLCGIQSVFHRSRAWNGDYQETGAAEHGVYRGIGKKVVKKYEIV